MANSQENILSRDLLEQREQLGKNTIGVSVDGRLIDLHTTLTPEEAEKAVPVQAHEDRALPIIRHSTAHVMADAVQKLFPGTKVAFGPATDDGFFYDYDRGGQTFSEDDLLAIEAKMQEIVEADSPFVREPMSKDELRTLLKDLDEPYKLEHLERLEGDLTVYRHGDWVDLCEGPHVPSTRFLKAFKLTHVAGAYWRGDERNPMLQRIYGTAFAKPKLLKRHLKQLEEAKARDHRKLGKELDLIAFHPLAPASPFFTPKGAKIYHLLVDYMRRLYDEHEYEELITPQIFDTKLFETSGHLPAYYENMYLASTSEHLHKAAEQLVKEPPTDVHQCAETIHEHLRFGIKPMNCPSHCLVFGMKRRSYRELPMRVADFGRLHRFERSGVVQGLTRVRTFCQDDGHIFCTKEQVAEEIGDFIDFVNRVYSDLAFNSPKIYIATRPEKRLGDDSVWDASEQALIEGVKAKGLPFEIAEGEGAFYGPKVEFHLKDAIGRSWQLGTIQADFNLPERFDLGYIGADNSMHRPVMLHRAIFGSLERFMGVLIEHLGGNFPVWLAPTQLKIVTVASDFDDYAKESARKLRALGFRVEADTSAERLGAKIRSARLDRIPYIGVVGAKERDAGGLQVRSRDLGEDIGLLSIEEMEAKLRAESVPPSLQ